MIGQISFFITIMTVFVRSNIAKFGQNAQFSKKKIFMLLKNYNEKRNEERKYNGLKEKIFTNKMVHQF